MILYRHCKYFAFSILLFCSRPSQGCLNENKATLTRKIIVSDDDFLPYPLFDINDTNSLRSHLFNSYSVWQKTGKTEDYSDYGVQLVYNGRYKEAKKLFIEIEKEKPGLYTTAANLGTTYELLGCNDSAYYWICRAVKINPASHDSSEWIHVKILEAKIRAGNDTNYFRTHSILSLDFGNTDIPENRGHINLISVQRQLSYQLNERMTFIKPRDMIIGQLLFDLGNIIAIDDNVVSGLRAYDMAASYGFSSELMHKRSVKYKMIQEEATSNGILKLTDNSTSNGYKVRAAIGLIVFIVFLYLLVRFLIRKKRKF